jgi:cytochrome c biogenesis protein CcmG/thiol:disulfide interchange protein DsbE
LKTARAQIFELMKSLILLSLAAVLSIATQAQVTALPSVTLKDMDGKNVNTADLSNDGKPILVCFWATWCSPCKKELNTYADYYEEWQKETGVKIYAVTIDDQRTVNSVKPYVNSVSWEYEILSDVNKTFSQAMGVNSPPHTFLLNGKGEIVWQHVGYTPGDEEEVHEQLLKLAH